MRKQLRTNRQSDSREALTYHSSAHHRKNSIQPCRGIFWRHKKGGCFTILYPQFVGAASPLNNLGRSAVLHFIAELIQGSGFFQGQVTILGVDRLKVSQRWCYQRAPSGRDRCALSTAKNGETRALGSNCIRCCLVKAVGLGPSAPSGRPRIRKLFLPLRFLAFSALASRERQNFQHVKIHCVISKHIFGITDLLLHLSHTSLQINSVLVCRCLIFSVKVG